MVKLAIIGSRGFDNEYIMFEALFDYMGKISMVISGGAKGADTLGEQWAKHAKIPTKIFYPDWDKHGKGAGFIRNQLIIDECDAVMAFWDGESKGTKHSIDLAEKQDKPVKIIYYKDEMHHL